MKTLFGILMTVALLAVVVFSPAARAAAPALPPGVSQVAPVALTVWPTNPSDAALVFAGDANLAYRFVINEFKGWHVIPGFVMTVTVPTDVVGELYAEDEVLTDLGSHKSWNEWCWTVLGGNVSYAVLAQSGTLWPSDRWLTPLQTGQKLNGEQSSFNDTLGCCYTVGNFVPLAGACKNKDGSPATLLANR